MELDARIRDTRILIENDDPVLCFSNRNECLHLKAIISRGCQERTEDIKMVIHVLWPKRENKSPNSTKNNRLNQPNPMC